MVDIAPNIYVYRKDKEGTAKLFITLTVTTTPYYIPEIDKTNMDLTKWENMIVSGTHLYQSVTLS